MKIFVFGSSILSSYCNGAATYYRGIYKELHRLGHSIVFAEPNAFGRQQHVDSGDFSFVQSLVYPSRADLKPLLEMATDSDLIVKHSGIGVRDTELESAVALCRRPGNAVVFWDVAAPATLARITANPSDPFRQLISRYDAVLTYGGGPSVIEEYKKLGARSCIPVYNALDPDTHFPVAASKEWMCDLAFVGNRLPDRERRVEELFFRAAALAPRLRFLLGGEGWCDKSLPKNVRWIGHVPSGLHNVINCSARMVLNINGDSMAEGGFSPPTPVFEAAGSGACLICDAWAGIEQFFVPGKELLVVRTADEIVQTLQGRNEADARRIGATFRKRALENHTYRQRAIELDAILRNGFPLAVQPSRAKPVSSAPLPVTAGAA